MLDLQNPYKEGLDNLLKWRNRYSKLEYPEKIVLNIFYRKYTIEFMWSEIYSCFEKTIFGKPKTKWTDFKKGYFKLKEIYGKTATSVTHSQLPLLLKDTNRIVGNTTYSNLQKLIISSQNTESKSLEELEYSYLYYLLTDESILLWAAIGGTGKNKIDAIGVLSGYKIETEDIVQYRQADEVIGKLCSASYLAQNYKALPPF